MKDLYVRGRERRAPISGLVLAAGCALAGCSSGPSETDIAEAWKVETAGVLNVFQGIRAMGEGKAPEALEPADLGIEVEASDAVCERASPQPGYNCDATISVKMGDNVIRRNESRRYVQGKDGWRIASQSSAD